MTRATDALGWADADSFGLRRALRLPWGWPAREDLQAEARALRTHAPDVLAPGHALLVTVDPSIPRSGQLWALCPPGHAFGDKAVPFAREAAAALDVAHNIVVQTLPFLLPSPHADQEWSAWMLPVPRAEPGPPPDGSSFGLAMALGMASAFLRVTLPADFIASAALGQDGTVHPVLGVDDKVDVIARFATGVTRIFVARAQHPEWQTAVAASPRPELVVVPVDSFLEAFGELRLEETFRDAFRERTADVADASDLADALFRWLLAGGAPLVSWKGIAETARTLASTLEEHGATIHAARARFSERIALRHDGASEPLPWPAEELLAGLRRPQRLSCFAHVVQSVTDSASDPVPTARDAWLRVAARVEDGGPEDAKLLGAIGRALAAGGAYEEAERALWAACEEWAALGAMQESAYPATELLRVAALRGPDALDDVLRKSVRVVLADPRTSTRSRAFLHLALLRVYVQAGRLQDAHVEWQHLAGIELHAPPHVLASARRWLARAADREEDTSASRHWREELDTYVHGRAFEPVYALLARLDAALCNPEDSAWRGELEALEGAAGSEPSPKWSYEVRRLLRQLRERGLRDRALAQAFTEEWRL